MALLLLICIVNIVNNYFSSTYTLNSQVVVTIIFHKIIYFVGLKAS